MPVGSPRSISFDEALKNAYRRVRERVILVPFSDCHYFDGSLNEHGYGGVRVKHRLYKAHRLAYEAEHGPIPAGDGYHGTVVMHSCDEPSCVNPAHLKLGTQIDNLKDACSKGRQYRGGRHHAKDFPLDHPKGHARLPKSKISLEDLSLIWRRLGEGCKLADIGAEVGLSRAMVSRIKNGHSHGGAFA